MTDDPINLLRELVLEVRGLRADLAGRGREPVDRLRLKDRKTMARIMPVLVANFADTFATWELLDYAAGHDALAADLRLVLGKLTAQQLGQLFQRAAGCDVGDARLIREGRDGNGARWRCSVTRASLPPADGARTLQLFNRSPEEGQRE